MSDSLFLVWKIGLCFGIKEFQFPQGLLVLGYFEYPQDILFPDFLYGLPWSMIEFCLLDISLFLFSELQLQKLLRILLHILCHFVFFCAIWSGLSKFIRSNSSYFQFRLFIEDIINSLNSLWKLLFSDKDSKIA